MTQWRYWLIVWVSACCAGAGGCIWTPRSLREVAPTTVRSRIESELVTSAVLAREDTSPEPMGRLGYKRGADDLLVLTRLTSKATDPKDPDGPRHDDYVERLWITIPVSAPRGSQLDLQQLDERFLIGYERDDQGRGMYARPCRTTGRLTVLQREAGTAVVHLELRAAPWREETWELRDTLVVPASETGIRATMVREVDTFHPDELWRIGAPVATGPRDVPADLGPAAPVASGAAGSVVGQWYTRDANWAVRFQFTADGNFYMTRTRGRWPLLMLGRYKLSGHYVILEIQDYYGIREGVPHDPHMHFIKEPITGMSFGWQGSNLVLYERVPDMRTDPPYFFRPTRFPDLRLNPPTNEVEP